jgi:preprotein translocase subunit SecB
VLSSKYTLANIAEDYFDIEVTFSVALQWSEDDGPVAQALKIECVFTGHFHTAKPVNQEHAKKFTDTESWLIFWPFFRQFVVDTTARMAIPPMVVPLALRPGEHSFRLPPAPPKGSARSKTAKAAPKRRKAAKK